MHIRGVRATWRAWSSTWLLILTALTTLSSAHSHSRGPIGTLFTVQNASIHTHNHRVTAFSQFDMSFILYNDYYVKFTLEPNHDILSPEGLRVNYLGADGKIRHQKPIDRMDHRVYKGDVWVRKYDEPWARAGHARVTVSRDGKDPIFKAAFDVAHGPHHIVTKRDYMQTRHTYDPDASHLSDDDLVLWRNSDVLEHNDMTLFERSVDFGLVSQHDMGCQTDMLNFNMARDHPIYTGMRFPGAGAGFGPEVYDINNSSYLGSRPLRSLWKRIDDNQYLGGNSAGVQLSSTIGQTQGCPTSRKVANVGIATDCTYTAQFASDKEAQANIVDILNSATAVWEGTFNISFSLANLTMSDSDCPSTPPSDKLWNQACSDGVKLSDRLSWFSQWRGQQSDDNSHWTLLSTCNTEAAVGLAWLGQSCNQVATAAADGAHVSGANVVVRTKGGQEWQILAHETGHTYGAVHDCTADLCKDPDNEGQSKCCPLKADTCDADGRYIMNPATGSEIVKFSPCSIGNICSAMRRNSISTSCLSDNKGIKAFGEPKCGNGIVEDGEDCDCGGDQGCIDNACCDASTCKYKSGATCDPTNDACCNNCQIAAKDTVCRESTGDCDPAEKCDGTSSSCPKDVSADDGTACGKSGDGLQCASGQCTSRNQQCQTQLGGYLNATDLKACDDDICTLSCESPNQAFTCTGLQQNFLNGTPCKHNGKCQNGQCKGASFDLMATLKDWYKKQPALFIAACVAIGLVVVFLVGSFLFKFWACCCGGGGRNNSDGKSGGNVLFGGVWGKRNTGSVMYKNPYGSRGSFGSSVPVAYTTPAPMQHPPPPLYRTMTAPPAVYMTPAAPPAGYYPPQPPPGQWPLRQQQPARRSAPIGPVRTSSLSGSSFIMAPGIQKPAAVSVVSDRRSSQSSLGQVQMSEKPPAGTEKKSWLKNFFGRRGGDSKPQAPVLNEKQEMSQMPTYQ